MNDLVQFLAIPLVAGLFSAAIYFLSVEFFRDLFKNKDLLLKIIGGIATLGVTLFSLFLSSRENLCEKQEKLATEIVTLLEGVTFAATNEIGLPKYCLNRSGLPMFTDNQAIFDARTKYGRDRDILNFKMIPLNRSSEDVLSAKVVWDQALVELEKECQNNKEFSVEKFFNTISILNDSRSKLISALGIFIADNCY